MVRLLQDYGQQGKEARECKGKGQETKGKAMAKRKRQGLQLTPKPLKGLWERRTATALAGDGNGDGNSVHEGLIGK